MELIDLIDLIMHLLKGGRVSEIENSVSNSFLLVVLIEIWYPCISLWLRFMLLIVHSKWCTT